MVAGNSAMKAIWFKMYSPNFYDIITTTCGSYCKNTLCDLGITTLSRKGEHTEVWVTAGFSRKKMLLKKASRSLVINTTRYRTR